MDGSVVSLEKSRGHVYPYTSVRDRTGPFLCKEGKQVKF